MKQKEFIATLYPIIQKYGAEYNVLCFDGVMAQAIIESNWGKSVLSAKYYNFFGMKTGSKWGGKKAELITADYVDGKLVKRKQEFRAYDSMEGGICGFFEFLEYKRYKKLHGALSVEKYAALLVETGYTNYPPYTSTIINTAAKYVTPFLEMRGADMAASDGLDAMARDVIRGAYGNGEATRSAMLYNTVQSRVNAIVGGAGVPNDAITTVAREVIAGAYGAGEERKRLLYEAVRERVNKLIKDGV